MKTVAWIVGLMSLALLGLIGIQLYLLDHAMELKKQAFRQNVNAAMSSIVQQLETQELVTKVFDVAVEASPRQQMAFIGMTVGRDSLLQSPAFEKKGAFFFSFTTDSTSFVTKMHYGKTGETMPPALSQEKRQLIIRKVLDDMTTAKFVPLEARVKPAVLDSLINTTLSAKGIATAYAYGVFSAPHDSLYFAKPAQFTGELKKSEFRSRLFPNDIFAARDELTLYFPQQNIYLLKQMVGWLASSFVLLGVVVFGFVYSTRTIYKQKQFAGAMADFINNMTHEFKTPISTIALASEALANAEIAKDENRLQRYNRIIRDENTRMRDQVEKILEMAALEEGDYELNLGPVDAHKVIAEAVKNIALQVEKRGGKIDCALNAAEHVIEADEIHLANVIHNLLDNANKYSPETPSLKITTANLNGDLRICIRDHGIGLLPEHQKRVFEKYYRVPTGNVHDVKGFGLGLSYVKLMVEAHGGTIAVKSELQKGSEFDISLPLRQAV